MVKPTEKVALFLGALAVFDHSLTTVFFVGEPCWPEDLNTSFKA